MVEAAQQPGKTGGSNGAAPGPRDHRMFDADLTGAVMNLHLMGRILRWLRPYRTKLVLSVLLVLITSFLTVVMEVVISRVLVDYIIVGERDSVMPDLGMISFTRWVEETTGLSALHSAGLIFFVLMTAVGIGGHLHRMTLIDAIVGTLRDLRQDLFAHV